MLAVAAASATGEKLPGESAGGGVGDRWSGRGGDRVSWDGTETADETGQEWCRGIKSAEVLRFVTGVVAGDWLQS
jgi:hypothetical protein